MVLIKKTSAEKPPHPPPQLYRVYSPAEPAEVDTPAAAPVVEVVFPYNVVVVVAPGEYNVVVGVKTY
jgi:hypothetical protein